MEPLGKPGITATGVGVERVEEPKKISEKKADLPKDYVKHIEIQKDWEKISNKIPATCKWAKSIMGASYTCNQPALEGSEFCEAHQ